MFQLYKQRNFSGYINDTIAFLKIYRKNFFGNYIVITGGMLALLCLLYFFIFRDLFSALFGTTNGGVGYDISYYFADNPVLFISLLMMAALPGILFSFFFMAYPVVYMKLTEETGRADFTAAELFSRIRELLPKIIRFVLYSSVTFIPLIMVAVILAGALVFLVAGVFMLILLIPTASVWFMQTFYVYLFNDVSFTGAMKQGWNILFSKKFWHIIGATTIVYLILSIMQGLFAMIPHMIVLFSVMVSGAQPMSEQMGIYLSLLYIVSILVSYIFFNVLMVNQGLIYYSALEQTEHIQALSEIDLIGQNVE